MKSNMRKLFLAPLLFSIICSFSQTSRITTSDGVQLHVTVSGEGTPCLYIHGGPGSGSYWLERFVGKELEEHFQMVYVDQRGVGRSSSPKDGNYSPSRMIRDFEEVRQNLGIESWLTLGQSMGGVLQMEYVLEHKEAIVGMIFINCSLSLADSFGNHWLPKAIELAAGDTPEICFDETVSIYERMLAIMPVLQRKGIMWKMFFKKEENSQKMDDTYSGFTNWNTDFGEIAMGIKEYWKDYRPFTSKVSRPVLFFYGKRDWAIGPIHYKEITFPNMTLWESKGGHMPFLEDKNGLLDAIGTFVDKHRF